MPNAPSRHRVSAVIPSYNHAPFIEEALAAFVAQALPFDEVVVVDDGSTDDSRERIRRWALRHPEIRFIFHPENQGVIAALNTGLHNATGDLVYFGAADDVVLPNFVADALASFERFPDTPFVCGEVLQRERPTGRIKGVKPLSRPSSTLRYFTAEEATALLRRIDFWIVMNAALFRRQELIDLGGFDACLGPFSDSYLARRLAFKKGFCYVPKILAEWHINPKSYSQATARDPDRALSFLEDAKRILSEDPLIPPWYPDLFERRWRAAVGWIAISGNVADLEAFRRVCGSRGIMDWILQLTAGLPAAIRKPVGALSLFSRYRPVSLRAVLRTKLMRMLSR